MTQLLVHNPHDTMSRYIDNEADCSDLSHSEISGDSRESASDSMKDFINDVLSSDEQFDSDDDRAPQFVRNTPFWTEIIAEARTGCSSRAISYALNVLKIKSVSNNDLIMLFHTWHRDSLEVFSKLLFCPKQWDRELEMYQMKFHTYHVITHMISAELTNRRIPGWDRLAEEMVDHPSRITPFVDAQDLDSNTD